jgi:hypothetical protein
MVVYQNLISGDKRLEKRAVHVVGRSKAGWHEFFEYAGCFSAKLSYLSHKANGILEMHSV